jgi:hypothetical protein
MQQTTACELTNIQEKIQKNGKYQKCSFDQSYTPRNQHKKSQQDQAKKKQNTKFQTQESV